MFSQYQCGRANGLNRARSAPLRHAEQAAEPGVAARSLVIWRSTRGGRSFGRGREVVRSDGRPTVDGDLGLSLDGRSRGWVNRWVGRSVGSNSLVVALCPGRSRASRGARIEIAICHWSADLDLSSFRSGPRDERLIMTYRIML